MERLSDKIREYLSTARGRNVNIRDIRAFLKVEPGSKDDQNLRTQMSTTMIKEKLVRPSGRSDGEYKVITLVKPVRVFIKDRERRPPFKLYFPQDDTGMEMSFAEDIVIREGDAITIGGVSNFGKTAIALNICGENIDYGVVLMGNEYTTRVGEDDEYEPTPRFLNRLDNMDWVEWTNSDGSDKFTLLPVRDDYAEHIIKDKINIIDWVNLEEHYKISTVTEGIKAEVGRGAAVIVMQKDEFSERARGGQFTKDFTDCELLIDKLTDYESMLTIGKVKEYTKPVMGRKFAFGILKGVKITNFREIVKCNICYGKGWKKFGNSNVPCDDCNRTGYVDK